MAYTDLGPIRLALRVPDDDTALGWQNETWTAALTLARDAAERMIDEHCDRTFESVTEARTFRAEHPQYLDIGDWQTISEVSVSSVAVDADVYTAAVNAHRDRPANGLWRQFGSWKIGSEVLVTGTWGWAEVPPDVKQAAVMTAARLFKRLDSPLGVTMVADEGMYVSRLDVDTQALLRPYCRFTFANATIYN